MAGSAILPSFCSTSMRRRIAVSLLLWPDIIPRYDWGRPGGSLIAGMVFSATLRTLWRQQVSTIQQVLTTIRARTPRFLFVMICGDGPVPIGWQDWLCAALLMRMMLRK